MNQNLRSPKPTLAIRLDKELEKRGKDHSMSSGASFSLSSFSANSLGLKPCFSARANGSDRRRTGERREIRENRRARASENRPEILLAYTQIALLGFFILLLAMYYGFYSYSDPVKEVRVELAQLRQEVEELKEQITQHTRRG